MAVEIWRRDRNVGVDVMFHVRIKVDLGEEVRPGESLVTFFHLPINETT